MPFWDDILEQIGASNHGKIAGRAYPSGTFAGGAAGSYGSNGNSDIFERITGIIDQSNRQRNGQGTRMVGRFEPNTGITPMGLGGQIGSGLAKQMSVQPPGNDINDILARLEELQDPSNYMNGGGDLESQAMAAASAQYDPVIAQLQQQMQSAEDRGQRNKAELGRMFGALSGSIQGEIPGIQKQYATDKKSAKVLQQNLQGDIKKQYNDSAAEQEQMMKRLGIEAAAGEVLPQQQRDRDYFVNQAGVQGQAEQAALGQEEAGTVDYTREGGQIARFEGTNRQADLMADLQDLLSQYEGQIGANKAAKNSAYISGLGELRSQAQSAASDQADRAAKNFLAEIQLGRDLRSDEFKYGQSAEKQGPVKSPGDISGRVLGMGLNNAQARGITDVMMTMLSRDPSIQSGTNALTGQSLPKEALASRIVEEGRRRHFSSQAINALMTVALEYFGRR